MLPSLIRSSELKPRPSYSDAIITKVKGIALGVVTADCVPVLLYDTKCYGSKAYAALSAEVILQEEYNVREKNRLR